MNGELDIKPTEDPNSLRDETLFKRSLLSSTLIDSQEDQTTLQDAQTLPKQGSWEMLAWYVFGWSNGPFWSAGLNSLTLVMTAQAKQRAIDLHGYHLLDSDGNPCEMESSTCTREPLSGEILPGIHFETFVSACTFISVAFQLVLLLTVGNFADYGPLRKKLMVLFNSLAVVSLLLFLVDTETYLYWLGGLIYILANLFFNTALLFFNAYMPILVNSMHGSSSLPSATPESIRLEEYKDGENMTAPAISKEEVTQSVGQLMNRASVIADAVLVISMLIGTFYNMGLLLTIEDEQKASRIAVALTGGWSLLFSSITFAALSPHPGPRLPRNARYLSLAWKQLKFTFQLRKSVPQTFRFLAAFLLFADGISTAQSAIAVFALVELNMSFEDIIVATVISNLSGVAADILFYLCTHYKLLSPRTILITSLVLLSGLPPFAYLSLTTKTQYFATLAAFGFLVSPFFALGRSQYARLIPARHETAFFSMYQICDKGTSWLGPLVLVIVQAVTDSFREAFFSLFFFFILGIILLWFVDFEKGASDAFELSQRTNRDRDNVT